MRRGQWQYTPAEDALIRRLFNQNASDDQIAARLQSLGRLTQAEAVRKRRRVLGLRKVPTYQRWTWGPFAHV